MYTHTDTNVSIISLDFNISIGIMHSLYFFSFIFL